MIADDKVLDYLKDHPAQPLLNIAGAVWPDLPMWQAEELARKTINRLYRRKQVKYEKEYKYRPGRRIVIIKWSLR